MRPRIEMSTTRKCPKRQFYRKSYTRKTSKGKKVHVTGKCIRSQSRYNKPYTVNKTRMRGFRYTKRALKSCPTGYIKRAAFTRKTKYGKLSRVPEQCITNVGNPGKGYKNGPGIGPLRKGELSKYGYTNVASMSVTARHKALTKAIQDIGSLGVWRKLNAVSVYTRKTSPSVSKLFKADMDWIRSTFGLKAFP
jgi:hypothetical protein